MDFKNPTPDPTTFVEHSKLADLYHEFIKDFPVVSIEDPFDQDDWAAWTDFTASTSIQVISIETVFHFFISLFCLINEIE